jgi:phage terminase large subunit-like protein
MLDTEGNQAAEPLWRALLPSTAQFGDKARIILSSTPYGQDGLFAEMYQRASSGELKDASAHHATTAEMNPTVTPAFLEHERERDPDGFASEYLAEFLSGGLAFIERERLFEVVDEERRELSPAEITNAVVGFDPSFSRDPAAIAVVGRHAPEPRLLVLAHAERWVPKRKRCWTAKAEQEDQVELVLDAVASAAKRYHARVVTDQHLPGVVVAGLADRGVHVRVRGWTPQNKTEAFKQVRARVYDRSLELYDEGTLLAELQRLRVNYRPGSAEVVNPRSGDSHGDMAVALAVSELETGGHASPEFWAHYDEMAAERPPALSVGVMERQF